MQYRVLTIRVDVIEAESEEEAKEKALDEDIIYGTYDAVLIKKYSDKDYEFDVLDDDGDESADVMFYKAKRIIEENSEQFE